MPDASVLVTWPDFDRNGSGTGDRLRAAGCSLRFAPKVEHRTPADMIGLLDGVAAAIVSTDPFDADVLASAPALRVIARIGVGTDSIDLDVGDAPRRRRLHDAGRNASSTADHAVALMLAALRRITEYDARVRAARWARTGDATAVGAQPRHGRARRPRRDRPAGPQAAQRLPRAGARQPIRRPSRRRGASSSSSTSCCGEATSCRSTCRSRARPGT